MSLEDHHHSLTLRGLVCPSDWSADEQVSRVSLFTFDDDEYEVAPEDAGALLFGHTGHEVELRGTLLPGTGRSKVILVKSFTVFGSFPAEAADGDPAPQVAGDPG